MDFIAISLTHEHEIALARPMAEADGSHWYAVYTKPRAEKKLRDALNKLKIENYLPLLRIRKKWSDRYNWQEVPAFASYIFVHISYRDQALKVLKIPQALQFVSIAGAPVTIPRVDMAMMKLALEHFAESLSIKDINSVHPGEKVLISEGPFAGREAIIEGIHGKTLVLVAFPALKKTIQVEISVQNLGKPLG